MISDPSTLPTKFQDRVREHLIDNVRRVSSFEFEDRRYWVKQAEVVKGRMRLFKPAPKRNFIRELNAYKTLHSMGVPVPEVVMEGETYFVLEDVGPTLSSLWRADTPSVAARAEVSAQAGIALARLHALGSSHGRPVAKDICWDGSEITFLDLENYSPRRNGARGRARDVLCFVHSLCSQPVTDDIALQAATDGYRENDCHGVWEEARAFTHRWGFVEFFTRPIQMRKEPHAREFKSLPKVLKIFE
ncbi:lipopolysaccharide kinase InaA family protein [Falsihalocynthiibacter sp. SS001]|uniref:lipopolysaccharide kinase InaA family protein n=1 Tax=Falsihalocynthiibacter sp. SS001 TaxID=3349698 RepID=UPI0036D3E625